jgi:DNA-binding MarR family transcriptional regulator
VYRRLEPLVKQKFKLKLTIEERILSHIREYSKYEHNLQAPFALTQDGIAKAVSVVRSAIPRSMKKLSDKGLVNEQIGHVEGVTRRRKIYYLTTEGLVRAQEITEKLERVNCHIKNQDGEVAELKLSEANKFLGTNFSMLEILEGLTDDGLFDYQAFISKRSSEESDDSEPDTAFLAYTEKAPKLSYFTGRDNELNTLREWLDGAECKIIVVHGIAGMGKTTLALRLIDEYRTKTHLVWYRFHQWDTLRYFFKTLANFLAELGRRELQRYIDTEPVLDLNTIGEILEPALNETNAIIVVDDFHKARDEVIPAFSLMLELFERISRSKLLIFSRHIVPFYDRRHVRVKKLVGELLLEGLSKDAARELLEHRGLPGNDLESIYVLTAGHPLSLELVEEGADESAAPDTEDLNVYIQEEIFSRLPENKRNVLAYAAVYRYGVPREMLLEYAEGGFETLSDLTKRALLELNNGVYNVHDLIKEFFYETQPVSVRKKYHEQAAAFYMNSLGDLMAEKMTEDRAEKLEEDVSKRFSVRGSGDPLGDAACEGLFHQIKSEQYTAAGELAAEHGEYLVGLDLAEELKELLSQLPLEKLSEHSKAMVLLLLGEVYNQLHEFEAAMNYYLEAVEAFRLIHGEVTDPKHMALIYRRMGFIYERREERESARECHEKSLMLAEKAKDALAISDAYGALGSLYWNNGEHERAQEFYDRCIGMADDIADMPARAKIYLGMCMALAKRGELEEALVYYEKCLDILERNEDIFKLARSYEGVGDHYLRSIFAQFMKSSERR